MVYEGGPPGTQAWRFVSFYCPFTVTRPEGPFCWFWSFSHWILKGKLGDVWRSFGLPDFLNGWAIGGPKAKSLPQLEAVFGNTAEAFDDCIVEFHNAYPHAVEQMSVRLCRTRLPANSGYRHL